MDTRLSQLTATSVKTLQVNITKLCNQACHHCHVDASPIRKEKMEPAVVEACLRILAENPSIETLDLTGGAPELHPDFDRFVVEARRLGKHVIVRHNLTVQLDGNPITGESKEYLPRFFAENKVEVISSLPCYQESNTDKQRGKGVYHKSIDALRALNAVKYGKKNSGLTLNLVYNPVGAFLPPDQETLEADYHRELKANWGIEFTHLLTITNMPIHRFKAQLERQGEYAGYMDKLKDAFNSEAAKNVMCRSLISVGYDGRLYDCDFNQMLEMQIHHAGVARTVFDFDLKELSSRPIRYDDHCFGCTAGQGSSCGGSTT